MEIGIREVPNLGNTPGGWYAISYFLSAVFFLYYNHNTRKGMRKWLPVSGIGAFLTFFMHITTGCYGLYFVTVMIIVFALIYSIFALCL